jgi:hypothetical protein
MHCGDKALAMQMLDESLNRLQTNHLDLWQIPGASFENNPALFMRLKRGHFGEDHSLTSRCSCLCLAGFEPGASCGVGKRFVP